MLSIQCRKLQPFASDRHLNSTRHTLARLQIMQVRMLLIRAVALGALAVSLPFAVGANSGSAPGPLEPALRELWNRGSERFQRQWLIAGPIAADVAASVDPAQLTAAAGQPLTPSEPGVKW